LKKSKRILLFICVCLMLTGCSQNTPDEYVEKAAEYSFELPTEMVAISYEVPVGSPNVLVDRFGYDSDGKKIVVFKGENLPRTFSVRDRVNDSIVYQGTIKTKENQNAFDEYTGYGEFTALKAEGNYYIQVDTYGESYPFLVHGNLYYSLFKRAAGKLHAMRGGSYDSEDGGWQMQDKGEDREINACLCIYQLLLSYEIFPEVHLDDIGIEESGNGIPDILDECRYELQWLLHQTQISPDMSGTACAYRAAVLAKYAYLTKGMDDAFAGECLRGAESAWKSAQKDLTVAPDVSALASAELYRLTGSRVYKVPAETYLSLRMAEEAALSDMEFFAGVTYMRTKSGVEVELCEKIIGKLMDEVEVFVQRSKQNVFFVNVNKKTVDKKQLLKEMLRISVVNHVITNHEYNTVIENHLHYLMGRNPDAKCYVSYWEGQEMQGEDILDILVENAGFTFMLSGLLSNQLSMS